MSLQNMMDLRAFSPDLSVNKIKHESRSRLWKFHESLGVALYKGEDPLTQVWMTIYPSSGRHLTINVVRHKINKSRKGLGSLHCINTYEINLSHGEESVALQIEKFITQNFDLLRKVLGSDPKRVMTNGDFNSSHYLPTSWASKLSGDEINIAGKSGITAIFDQLPMINFGGLTYFRKNHLYKGMGKDTIQRVWGKLFDTPLLEHDFSNEINPIQLAGEALPKPISGVNSEIASVFSEKVSIGGLEGLTEENKAPKKAVRMINSIKWGMFA